MAGLEPEDYAALLADSKVVSLKYRKRLLTQDQPVDAVYFPLTAMVSLLVSTGGPPTEMANIGNEGVAGAAELLAEQGAMGLNLVQIPGSALRIEASAFRRLVESRPPLQRLISRHMLSLMRQVLYVAVCNRHHSMEERCVRWLLMTHDRAGHDTFPITQEFLSSMLGVRRASVNIATGALRKAGFIRYVRGKLTVVDRPGLESAACGCYQAIVKVYSSPSPRA